MQLAQIKYFLAACETTNFTHAAKACNVTQPALTRSIRLLEDELGSALFLREHHLTQLTPFGKTMRVHLEQILADTDRLREAARRYKAKHTAALNLGVLPTIAPTGFRDLLKQFGGANKGPQLNLFERDEADLLELLLDGTVHLAIMAGTNDERFRGIRLYGERYKVAFPQGHRFNDMTSIRLTDLAEERLVARPNCAVISALRHACRDRDVVLEPEMTSENEFWSQAVVAAGLGVMLISETTPVAAGIATRPLADLALQRDVNLVSVAGRYVAPAVARFIRAAQNHVWTYSTTAA